MCELACEYSECRRGLAPPPQVAPPPLRREEAVGQDVERAAGMWAIVLEGTQAAFEVTTHENVEQQHLCVVLSHTHCELASCSRRERLS